MTTTTMKEKKKTAAAAYSPHRELRLLFLLAFAALLAWLPAAQARQVPVPEMRTRVVDLADTLQPSQAESLREQIAELERATQAQLAVLVVPTTGEDSIEQYATRVFARWKLGREDADDGVLLLVALKDRRMRIEVGTGLEGKITDIQAARIIDQQMTPRFRNGDFAGGIEAAVQSLSQLIDATALAPQVAELPEPAAEEAPSDSDEGGITPAGWALFGVLLWSIAVGVWQGRQPARRELTAEEWMARRASRTARTSGRKGRRERAAAQALSTMSVTPVKRWPVSFALLAAAPVVAAVIRSSPVLLVMLVMLPVPIGFGIGVACGRWKSARIVAACVALLIAAIVATAHFIGGQKTGVGLIYGFFGLIGSVFVTLIGLGMRGAWRAGTLNFTLRLLFVLGAMLLMGTNLHEIGEANGSDDSLLLPLLLVALVSSSFAFIPMAFPGRSAGPYTGGSGDDDSDWGSSSSSSSSSSYSSSSSSSSSSSGGGGSSSGGGASGSW